MKSKTSNPTSGRIGPKSPPAKGKSKLRQESAAAKPSDRLRREGEAPPGASGRIGPKSKGDKKAAKDTRRMDKSKLCTEKTGDKLDAAREKLAAQKPPKKPGAVKTLSRAAGYEVWAKAHGKIHEVIDGIINNTPPVPVPAPEDRPLDRVKPPTEKKRSRERER